ncbi:MAG: aspartate carbamoyltransferase [Planctomycetota bacterium]
MTKRDFISIRDFSNEEMIGLFAVADRMQRLLRSSHGLLAGHIMGSLFLEPSTRTRLSFESAMNRLGGRVITLADAGASSFSKGETLADSVQMVGSYTDVIVLRHPRAGAARLAAKIAPVPVINAGDGGHEHPTQTLCDLYALRRVKGKLDGLKVVLYGDLKYGRTTHSLALALVGFGSDVLCISETGLDLPDYVRQDCRENGDVEDHEVAICGMERLFGEARRGILFTRDPAAWGLEDDALDLAGRELDAIYVTRLQRERLAPDERDRTRGLPSVDTAFLAERPFENAVVLHPLPRLDEIHPDVDRDPRGLYFRQAAWGVPIRMALLSYLLGTELVEAGDSPARPVRPLASDERCTNANCIVNDPQAAVEGEARTAREGGDRCAFCDAPLARS